MKDKLRWAAYYLLNIWNYLAARAHLGGLAVYRYYRRKLDRAETQDWIRDRIEQGVPTMVARYGGNESHVTGEAIGMELGLKKGIRKKILLQINRDAGLFPYGNETAYRFGMLMKESSRQLDLLAVWHTVMQDYLVNCVCPADMLTTDLADIEPYYCSHPWTSALAGKKVVVVHPFQKTIEDQYLKREKLFADPEVLPEFELRTVKAVQTIAYSEDDRFSSWFDALDYMFREVMKEDFDVAILGCGAYGFPLAAKIRAAGKTAIHLGGATQLLFGIKGKRWDTSRTVSTLYNEYWVRPSEEDRPKRADAVEDGCYW
ncbi:MAG: hypothetical protein IJK14_00625 [Clostridia bacterium]|nr:hypothetical protein [Clostridia bacterium]MBR0443866.1 hypothetical protein [Clostridia bacterium]